MTRVPLPAAERTQSSAAISAEFVMTDADFRRIADMLHADAGIHVPPGKAALVYSRLTKRLRALGMKSFRDYCELVASHAGVTERQQMLAALTTNVTRFFREPHHFEHLRRHVLPPLMDQAKRGGRVRLWSAACSNGAEPYSIGLTVLSLLPEAANYDIKILATDIDPNMVAEGRAGTYSDSLMEPVPADQRLRWFSPSRGDKGKTWTTSDALRSLIAFRELNLIGNWPMRGKFDAIFCRNVVIYFEEDTQARLWSRFLPQLNPKGRLYIGHSERVSGPAAKFFESEGITTYRVRQGERAR
jgi:chemotaxis protein methyltransferase CheR